VKFTVGGEGRAAETEYRVEETFAAVDVEKIAAELQERGAESPRNFRKNMERSYQGFSLVSCWPKTGRTHQIRVHFSHIHHPLVADATYLGKKRVVLDHLWCSRLFLHAAQLEFTHPRTHEPLIIAAPLLDDLRQTLTLLKTV
jgi:23S rRNA-/tRNA-specific pseudouridylate synthase